MGRWHDAEKTDIDKDRALQMGQTRHLILREELSHPWRRLGR